MLTFTNMSLRRGKKILFNDVNIRINASEKVGLTGANGTGKSSLIKLILGELHADNGDVSLPKNMITSHVAQEIAHSEEKAIDFVINGDQEYRHIEKQINDAESRNNVEQLAQLYDHMQNIDGYSITARAAKLMNGLGFTSHQEQHTVNAFSGGWRMRLNLAKALMCRSDLLLLDEPTNHLDLEAIIWLEEWLKRYTGIVLLISHDRDFLNAVCQHIINIEHQKLTQYTGNYDAFENIRAEQLQQQQSQFDAQQKHIKHMQKYIDRFRYKASKAKQAQSRVKALERMEKVSAAQLDSPFNFHFIIDGFIPQQLVKIDKANAGYGDTVVLKNVQTLIQKGDKIGLLGFNGAGKSTLIKLIAEQLQAFDGEVTHAKEIRIGYFAQHQIEQLHSDMSPVEHLKLVDPEISEQQARNFLGGFAFHSDMAQDSIDHFSGGEKARLVLALIVYQKPNVLLLDEPTNHLDIRMRHAIGMALQSFEGAMILVSHDRYLLSSVTDKLMLVANGSVSDFSGDLQDYYHWANETRKNRLIADSTDESNDSEKFSKKQSRQQAAQIRQAQKPLRQELKKLEKQLDKLQKQSDKLDDLMLDETLYTEAKKEQLKKTTIEQSNIKKSIEELEEQWFEVSEQLS